MLRDSAGAHQTAADVARMMRQESDYHGRTSEGPDLIERSKAAIVSWFGNLASFGLPPFRYARRGVSLAEAIECVLLEGT